MEENSFVQWFLHQDEKMIGVKAALIKGGSLVAGLPGAIGGLLLFMLVENLGEGFLRVGERGIEIVEDKIEEAKRENGKKAELARLAGRFLSPELNLAKGFFNPEALKNILGNKDDTVQEAKKFFNELSEDKDRKKAFDEEILKLLTGKYEEKEFEKEIKDKFDIKMEKEALGLYLELRDFIFHDEVKKTLAEIIANDEDSKQKILSKLDELNEQSKQTLKKLETKLQKFREDIFLLDEGFHRMTPLYFYYYKSGGINNWKEGWKPRLVDVYANIDYKRKIIGDLKKEGNFLILGESGYSKSTMLYRVICDFYEKYYNVIASLDEFGGGEIKQPQKIVEAVKDLLSEGRVLVAIDNVQDKMRAFEIIRNLADHKDFDRIKFVFTARLPEFEDIIQKKMGLYEDDTRQAIKYSLANLITEIPIVNFDLEEAEGFVRKFYPLIHGGEIAEESLKKGLPDHYKLSNNGHPILFKYMLTGEGIEDDVEGKYYRYIFDRKTAREDERKIEAALFSCILDLCGIKITGDLASRCRVNLRLLKGSILKYTEPTDTWETMHPVWDIEFLKFIRGQRENSEETVKQIVKTIVSLKDRDKSYKLIYGLANTVAYNEELLCLFEPSLKVPKYIDDAKKARLYAHGLGFMWLHKLERFEKSLEATTKSVEIFEKLIKTDDKFKEELAEAYLIRGDAHLGLGEEPVRVQYTKIVYYDEEKGIKWSSLVKDDEAYSNSGLAHYDKGELELAIQDYDKVIELDPKNERLRALAYNSRGNAHRDKGELELAIQDYDKVIELDPKYIWAYNDRGNVYSDMGELELAIQDYDKVIELDPKCTELYAGLFKNKGNEYYKKGDYDFAIQYYDKAIKLDPEDTVAYFIRKSEYYKKGEFDSCVIKLANIGFLFLIRAYENEKNSNILNLFNIEFLKNAIMLLELAFNFDESKNGIKFEAGVALSAILKIEFLKIKLLLSLTEIKKLKYSEIAEKMAEDCVNLEKSVEKILSKVKEEKSALSASAKAVLTVLEGGDDEINEIKYFNDAAFALLLNALWIAKNSAISS